MWWKFFDTSPIIQRHRPTWNKSGQHFHGYKRKKFRNNLHRNSKKLLAAAQIFGIGQLGFGHMEMGAHSLHYGAATTMYLTGVSPLTIVIIKIFRIDAFLPYIRKQVAQFSTKLSDKNLENKYFFSIPYSDKTIQEATNGYFPSSPRTPNIDKEHGLPRALRTWKPVPIGRLNLNQ